MSEAGEGGRVQRPRDADPFGLVRFLREQQGAHESAVRELRAGRKTGHWIWFEFPQLAGLGGSEMSRQFAISGLEEARAYLAHPVLGPRLRECCEALLIHAERPVEEIMGWPVDAMKLRSSLTLFHRADPSEPVFRRALDAFFGGEPDPLTDELLERDG